MKTETCFPRDWQIILFAAIIFFLALQSCKTTKNVHQVKSNQEIKSATEEKVETSSQAETITKTLATAETQTTEECDTMVWIWAPMVSDSGTVTTETYEKIAVPIRFKRTTTRKEFTQGEEKKKESQSTTAARKEQLTQKSETVLKDKTVERTGLPGWAIAIIIIFILAGVAVLLWRLKVF